MITITHARSDGRLVRAQCTVCDDVWVVDPTLIDPWGDFQRFVRLHERSGRKAATPSWWLT